MWELIVGERLNRMTTANTHQFNIISLGKFIEIRWISMDSNDLWQEKSKTCVVWGVCKWIMGDMIKYNINCKYLPLHCYLSQWVYRMKTRPAWNPMPLTRRIEIICSLWHELRISWRGYGQKLCQLQILTASLWCPVAS